MNSKRWDEHAVRNYIKKGWTQEDFCREYQIKDKDELKSMLGRIYHFEEKSISDRLEEMDANKKRKGFKNGNNKNKAKKQNNVSVSNFVPLNNLGMIIPYNSNVSSQLISAKNFNQSIPNSVVESSMKKLSKLPEKADHSTVASAPTELEILQEKLRNNENYIIELQEKIASTNEACMKDKEWFEEIIETIRSFSEKIAQAKLLASEKINSIKTNLDIIEETNQLLDIANADSDNLKKQISELKSKKVYFGSCKDVKMSFDYMADSIKLDESVIDSSISKFFSDKDIFNLISKFSGEDIKKLAEITHKVSIIRKGEAPDIGLKLYFDETNEFTEMVSILCDCDTVVLVN